jgi:hypothetical protein
MGKLYKRVEVDVLVFGNFVSWEVALLSLYNDIFGGSSFWFFSGLIRLSGGRAFINDAIWINIGMSMSKMTVQPPLDWFSGGVWDVVDVVVNGVVGGVIGGGVCNDAWELVAAFIDKRICSNDAWELVAAFIDKRLSSAAGSGTGLEGTDPDELEEDPVDVAIGVGVGEGEDADGGTGLGGIGPDEAEEDPVGVAIGVGVGEGEETDGGRGLGGIDPDEAKEDPVGVAIGVGVGEGEETNGGRGLGGIDPDEAKEDPVGVVGVGLTGVWGGGTSNLSASALLIILSW